MRRRITAWFLFLLAFAACRKAPPPPRAYPRQTLTKLSLSQSYLGASVWKLQSPSALLEEATQKADLDSPRMQFYKEGRLSSRVSSLTGRVNLATHDVILSTDVVLVSMEDQSVLKTDLLNYSSKEDKLWTESEVELRKPAGVMRGRGMRASPDLSDVRIFHQESHLKGVEKNGKAAEHNESSSTATRGQGSS